MDSSLPGVPKVELRAEDGVLCCACRDGGGGGRKATQWEEQRGWGPEAGTDLPKPQEGGGHHRNRTSEADCGYSRDHLVLPTELGFLKSW